mmetsp:Transcript_68698/g.217285  ORF Transcript_68698/g.217285 Transcript_68698/m.217285 type:complete len:227 (+) Transcript_68698:320-1000(+)
MIGAPSCTSWPALLSSPSRQHPRTCSRGLSGTLYTPSTTSCPPLSCPTTTRGTRSSSGWWSAAGQHRWQLWRYSTASPQGPRWPWRPGGCCRRAMSRGSAPSSQGRRPATSSISCRRSRGCSCPWTLGSAVGGRARGAMPRPLRPRPRPRGCVGRSSEAGGCSCSCTRPSPRCWRGRGLRTWSGGVCGCRLWTCSRLSSSPRPRRLRQRRMCRPGGMHRRTTTSRR